MRASAREIFPDSGPQLAGAYDSESALARVQHLYASHMPKARIHPESPQTPAQKDYIRNWNVAR